MKALAVQRIAVILNTRAYVKPVAYQSTAQHVVEPQDTCTYAM